MSPDDLREQQGWSDETWINLCERFISEQGHSDAWLEFLEKIADEENSEAEEE